MKVALTLESFFLSVASPPSRAALEKPQWAITRGRSPRRRKSSMVAGRSDGASWAAAAADKAVRRTVGKAWILIVELWSSGRGCLNGHDGGIIARARRTIARCLGLVGGRFWFLSAWTGLAYVLQ